MLDIKMYYLIELVQSDIGMLSTKFNINGEMKYLI